MSTVPSSLPPAPGAGGHVSLALVDSRASLPGGLGQDELDSPAAATQRLIARGLVPEGTALLEHCQDQLAGLRETLRAVFAAWVEGAAPASEVLVDVNRALIRIASAQRVTYDEDRGLLGCPPIS